MPIMLYGSYVLLDAGGNIATDPNCCCNTIPCSNVATNIYLTIAGVATKAAPDNSVVYPDTDGTVYYTVGSGGRPRTSFQPGSLDSYRGDELADTFVPNSYVWAAPDDTYAEAVAWSRVRFRNYAFIRVDVRPGFFVSEMDVVAVDEYGREFDRLTFRRAVPAVDHNTNR